jgi:phosphate:Na+ symporter
VRFRDRSVSTLLALAVVTLAAARAHAADGATLTVEVSRPSPHSRVFVGAVGDTLAGEIVLSLSDAEGAPVAGVALSVRPVGVAAAVPVGRTHVTDPRGDAVVPVRLVGPPGDALLLARIPGQEDEIEIRVRVLRRSWLPLLVIGICGGLALFLYGLRLIGRSFEKAAGGGMRSFLGSMTGSRFRSLVFGAVSSLVVQSSGASTVLLVSFASSGLVTVRQCLGAVLGAAIGATVTTQLIAFRISDAALALVALGFVLTMFRGNRRRIGGAILGLGLIFYGLQVMSSSMAPLKDFPVVNEFFVDAASDPWPALVAAAIFTALVHASAATIGIVLGLAFQGIVSLEAAIPFVFGANVGTASTAILASLGANVEGKRVAWAHAAFRAGGVALGMLAFAPFVDLVRAFPGDLPRQIANAHTLINLGTALLFLPLIPLADRVFERLIPAPEAEAEFGPKALDPRFHEQPSIAIASAVREILRMGGLVIEMLEGVEKCFRHDQPELAKSIRTRDDQVDLLDESITKYLVDLSTEYLSERQSERVLDLLFVTKDLELIGDIVSKNLVPGLLRKKHEEDLRFSDEGFRQISEFQEGVREIVEIAVSAVATWDAELARDVLAKKRQLSLLERRFQLAHLQRLRTGNPEARATTTVHVDAMNDLKRIVTHTARIAYAILGKVHQLPPENGGEDRVEAGRPAGETIEGSAE